MLVRRDPLREKAQRRVAVALADVAQHLVVGAVLLDDVDAMFDRAGPADRGGDGVVCLGCAAYRRSIRLQRAASISRASEFRHVAGLGHRDDAQRPAEQAGDVLRLAVPLPRRIRPLWIGPRNDPFAVGHQDLVGGERHPHARRIPADGNEAQRAALATMGNIDHGQVIGVGIGHPQRFAVRHRPGSSVYSRLARAG